MRNLFIGAVMALASLFGVAAHADDIQAGKQYTVLESPVPVSQPGKIEVVELFWYACPHCYEFDKPLSDWAAKLPADVNFHRVPAMFGGIWDVHGQMFVTLDAMGVEHKIHTAVFDAIHKEHKMFKTPEEMADFVATQGVDKGEFLSTYNSFAVKGKVDQYKKLAQAYGATGVPTMIVNGKYRFDIGSSGSIQGALNVADTLIEKERAAKGAGQ